ncbi:MAG: hypothetical protein JW982_10040 [Spirochaetes bacterium]|nr:hypothetical protein [Spirochaetota bacterium]
MCTSFISRKNDVIIGMNFDNNGMIYSISDKIENWFIVYVDTGRGRYPSFGVDRQGRFFNSLIVGSNGKGLYRRPSSKVNHTTKLVTDLINGVIRAEDLNEYLEKVEIVNTPDQSCHNMICDSNANVWIIEPGRGSIFSPSTESSYFSMSNESLIDLQMRDMKSECPRYTAVMSRLSSTNEMDVDSAFEILKSVSQTDGEWKTDLSMVFSKKQSKVYYCLNNDFSRMFEFDFSQGND